MKINPSETIGIPGGNKTDKYVVVTTNQVGDGMTKMMYRGTPAQGVYEDCVTPEAEVKENDQTLYTNYNNATYDEVGGDE